MIPSRPFGSMSVLTLMDRCQAPRLLFLLIFTSTASLCGNPLADLTKEANLLCVTDYLLTINCSLHIAPSENATDVNTTYWLNILWTHRKQTFQCMLTNSSGLFSCSMKTCDESADARCKFRTFKDISTYEIFLCRNHLVGSEECQLLVQNYKPPQNIKPNPPCCLTFSHNGSQHHFTWTSTYELYDSSTDLTDNMNYQLNYYTTGHNAISHDINTNKKEYSIDDENFAPDTEYTARVRSSPNQAFYMGHWSDWSPEVHWKTDAVVNDFRADTFISGLAKVFIPLGVLVPLVFTVCCFSVKKWRQRSFIPTPAPYFHTLYSDCQGDFKSWVVTAEKPTDVLKTEKTLLIDMLTKCEDIQEVEEPLQPQVQQQTSEGGGGYRNISDPGCDTFLLGVPYAVSTMIPASESVSTLRSCSSHPGSHTEGDSGCWLCSHTSLEKEPPLYCNQYCTLSAFQQAEQQAKSWPTGTIRVEEVIEA